VEIGPCTMYHDTRTRENVEFLILEFGQFWQELAGFELKLVKNS